VLAARGSALLLLDEPTSALDPVSEAQVYARLEAAFAQACIVASVHRMSLLPRFDRVVLMAEGRVVDCGTPHELAARQALFRQLVGDGAVPAQLVAG
jgi:ABC-type bacteriocin/lantibiotic exporter with double-glycine peptidase domain